MESNLREFEGKMVFEDLKRLFISEKKVLNDGSQKMLVFKDEGIDNKEEFILKKNIIVSSPLLPKKVKKISNEKAQKMIDFSNEHINKSFFIANDIICKSIEIEFES